ncbi:ABC transporter permease [Peteryoungia ipomoeae]|uniref:Uncharacterized protein n=1 Tax=Peteryoungia ipomoeae TaxID=1210932 RepID=A0A4S8P1E7_9HYPH|nr:ABC transporter permease [Peteryoungia ipomoeae]THV21424.1 hypothetical protein FAA97_15530 [Peteryoungia ipomoeae]
MMALLSGEMRKLLRQPGALFFGFFGIVFLTITFKIGLEAIAVWRMGRMPTGSIDLYLSAAKAMSISGNTLGHLLYAIGIGTVFATEYRYATWRLLVPRHSRLQLYGAKFLVCLVALAASLLVAGLGDMLVNLTRAALEGQGAVVSLAASSASRLVLAFMAALLELAVLAAFVGLITTVFRSMMPAIILAFLLILGSSMVHLYLGSDADALPLPSYGAEFLRSFIVSGDSTAQAGFGAISLLVWLALLFLGGAACFQRQQLTSE